MKTSSYLPQYDISKINKHYHGYYTQKHNASNIFFSSLKPVTPFWSSIWTNKISFCFKWNTNTIMTNMLWYNTIADDHAISVAITTDGLFVNPQRVSKKRPPPADQNTTCFVYAPYFHKAKKNYVVLPSTINPGQNLRFKKLWPGNFVQIGCFWEKKVVESHLNFVLLGAF